MVDAAARERARVLTLRYLLASTAILLASGLLGVVLRLSQADLARLDDDTYYAVMTAHGLGAFVGWAAFAVMGFSWWVLASVGFPLRRLGAALAEAAFWLMVTGVAGVLVTTLLMNFGASWVFLYPLPFESAGQWSDLAAGLFSASVLLVGLSIVTWCVGVVHTIVGPALHAVRPSFGNRIGVALGLGYLWPRRFATNPSSVPYPVIPLTVIGLDMIVATLPLAGLLAVMVWKAADPSVSVDPLLAKNILWFFGHPVVYLLLFPAVAIFYLLVPRFAGRELVAGDVVAVAWVLAVVINVAIWAHHVYLDYPEGTIQGAINTAHQPLTFAIVLPSALSLYSLAFTIYRSDWRWTGASTALFLALLSWLLAGLSGIVQATIAFQETVHNTLWIVGHFHHMALVNIGLVIFAAVYAFLPELVRKPLFSDALAKWHIWLTFVCATAVSALWIVQGLDGAPRRYSVLPDRYDALTKATIPFVAVLGFAQLLFAWNIVQTMRGAGFVTAAERRRRRPEAVAESVIVLLALGLAFFAAVVGFVIGRETAPSGAERPAAAATAATTSTAESAGRAAFAKGGCASCHTLSAAGASGTIGPSLDETTLDADAIARLVTTGRGGMPSFRTRLSEQEIRAVARFVGEVRRGGSTP